MDYLLSCAWKKTTPDKCCLKKGMNDIEYVVELLEEKNVSVVSRRKHSYIMYQGIESEYLYVLKEGVVKLSSILRMVVSLILLMFVNQILFHCLKKNNWMEFQLSLM